MSTEQTVAIKDDVTKYARQMSLAIYAFGEAMSEARKMHAICSYREDGNNCSGTAIAVRHALDQARELFGKLDEVVVSLRIALND